MEILKLSRLKPNDIAKRVAQKIGDKNCILVNLEKGDEYMEVLYDVKTGVLLGAAAMRVITPNKLIKAYRFGGRNDLPSTVFYVPVSNG